jgi:hypothetical protein
VRRTAPGDCDGRGTERTAAAERLVLLPDVLAGTYTRVRGVFERAAKLGAISSGWLRSVTSVTRPEAKERD